MHSKFIFWLGEAINKHILCSVVINSMKKRWGIENRVEGIKSPSSLTIYTYSDPLLCVVRIPTLSFTPWQYSVLELSALGRLQDSSKAETRSCPQGLAHGRYSKTYFCTDGFSNVWFEKLPYSHFIYSEVDRRNITSPTLHENWSSRKSFCFHSTAIFSSTMLDNNSMAGIWGCGQLNAKSTIPLKVSIFIGFPRTAGLKMAGRLLIVHGTSCFNPPTLCCLLSFLEISWREYLFSWRISFTHSILYSLLNGYYIMHSCARIRLYMCQLI